MFIILYTRYIINIICYVIIILLLLLLLKIRTAIEAGFIIGSGQQQVA